MKTKVFAFISIIIFLTACSSTDTTKEDNNNSKTNEATTNGSNTGSSLNLSEIEKVSLNINSEAIQKLAPGSLTKNNTYEKESKKIMWGIDELDQERLNELKEPIEKLIEQTKDSETLAKALVYYAGTPFHQEIFSQLNNYQANFQEPYLPTPKTVNNDDSTEDIDNAYILLDASSSMLLESEGDSSKQRMEIAREAVRNFAKTIGESSKVSLVAFGHKGDQSDAGKEKSCKGIEEVYTLDNFDNEKFTKTVEQVNAKGWTPLAKAIDKTDELSQTQDGNTTVYIVSDGVETCGGDPVATAQAFTDNETTNKAVNIIGFQVDKEAEAQLTDVAKAGNGEYYSVNNSEELQKTIEYEWLPSLMKLTWAPVNLAPDGFDILHKKEDVNELSQDWTAVIKREDHRFQSILSDLKEDGTLSSELTEATKQIVTKRKDNLEAINATLKKNKRETIQHEADDIKEQVENWVEEMEKLKEQAS